jgi:NAD+ synthase (glutamine-hydrolysing)
MKKSLCILMAQINPIVGDIEGNTALIIQAIEAAKRDFNADLIVFPELTITGYPPEDLLLRSDLHLQIQTALEQIRLATLGIAVIVGYPHKVKTGIYNAAGYFTNQTLTHTYYKQCLPNYGVFDEKRYFIAGDQSCIIDLHGTKIGLLICEDGWEKHPAQLAKAAGAELLISINASPFDKQKSRQREGIIATRVMENHLPFIYVACVGGQDELVFDGGSFAMNADGVICAHAGYYESLMMPLIWEHGAIQASTIAPELSELESIYRAICLGIQDYVRKNHFKGILLGVSGGIDSALVLCLAVDALGAENVQAVLLPSRYTSPMSLEDALLLIKQLQVSYTSLSIEPAFEAVMETLSEAFIGGSQDVTEQNIQARCRGLLLMALSNKTGALLLTTSNKSETAVGYATLYGDMAGGFAPIKDVPKTMVYALAHYRNTRDAVIPERIITRAPTAELAPNQTDQDTLPDYDTLDKILEKYVEEDKSVEEIVNLGFSEPLVRQVLTMVNKNEYKRRQSAPGIRITQRAFGRERRYPITSGFKNLH